MEAFSPRLPNSLFPYSSIVDDNENTIILADDRSATGLPISLPPIIFSPNFEDLVCGTVDNRDVSNIYSPTVATTSIINTPPPAGNYNSSVVSQTQEKHDSKSVFDVYDTEDDPVTSLTEGPGQDLINTYLNSVFDDTDDSLSFELKAILNHGYLAGILEFELEYDNGEIS